METNGFSKIVILILIIIILVFGYFLYLKIGKPGNFEDLLTDKSEYSAGDTMRVKIKNTFGDLICFSSCYPYYFEKKNSKTEWEGYKYSVCPAENLPEKCVKRGEIKAFEIILPVLEKGIHRLTVPIYIEFSCHDCEVKGIFKESLRLYSNEFNIK